MMEPLTPEQERELDELLARLAKLAKLRRERIDAKRVLGIEIVLAPETIDALLTGGHVWTPCT